MASSAPVVGTSRGPSQSANVGGDEVEPIALFDAQLGDVAKNRGAPSPGRESSKQWNLVDQSRYLLGGDFGPDERGRPRHQGTDRLVELRPDVFRRDPTAHPFEYPEEPSTSRVEADSRDAQLTRFGKERRTDRKGGRRRITGDVHLERGHKAGGLEGEPTISFLDQIAEGAEQTFGVIS